MLSMIVGDNNTVPLTPWLHSVSSASVEVKGEPMGSTALQTQYGDSLQTTGMMG